MSVKQKDGIQIYSEMISSDAYEVCRQVKVILNRLERISEIDDDQQFDIRVILSELLQNAIRHGNANDSNKKVFVDVWLHDDSRVLSIRVTDQGQGFDVKRTIECRGKGCSDELAMDESGRGLLIVRNLCDDIQFNPVGNAITVRTRLGSH
ncbi:MAG TPA: ATP-binding protein [Thermoclostridium sp.]|nr:ATP-binding protein [Thermoclostridium sp.]